MQLWWIFKMHPLSLFLRQSRNKNASINLLFSDFILRQSRKDLFLVRQIRMHESTAATKKYSEIYLDAILFELVVYKQIKNLKFKITVVV